MRLAWNYWVIQSSWGRQWGVKGMAYVQRGVNCVDFEGISAVGAKFI